MKYKSKRKTVYLSSGIKKIYPLACAGALAGLCNGALGAGGGVVIVLFLSLALKKEPDALRNVYANALCVMLPLSLLTLVRYGKQVSIRTLDFSPTFIFGAILGGVLGAILLGYIRKTLSGKLFAVLTVLSGILMILR